MFYLLSSYDEIDSLSIYIQMELCKDTLADFLETRNKKSNPKNKKMQTQENLINEEDLEYSLNLFDKILNGVEHIHKEDLIHRDLKPNNIFFSLDNQLKIGDLGLATNALNRKCEMLSPSPILDRSLDKDDEAYIDAYDDTKDELALDSSFKLEIEETITSSSYHNDLNDRNREFIFKHTEDLQIHTTNIGTSQYAAPEQLNNIYYNNKVDIFPLGLILLELIYPFKTRMEKQEIFDNLKLKKILPKVISDNFPKISEMILLMTDADPERRPNIIQCRNLFKSISNSLNKTENIKVTMSEKRKRFMSEDIQGVKSFEFLSRLADSQDWKSW